jgi:hypothetical protein
MLFTNGYKYEGGWHRDKEEGHGAYMLSSGERTYYGEWKAGNMEGRGVYTCPNGERYDGEWRANKMEGRGLYTHPDGTRYDGEHKAGKRWGHGVYTHSNGERYDGEYKADRMDGRGVYTHPDGRRYDGGYKADLSEGRGHAKLADGRVFEGLFKRDMPISGMMVERNGSVFFAIFDGKTDINDWRPSTRQGVGSLERGWRDARGPREFEWDGGRFGGSWRGMCPVAGTLVKADGSEWAVVYDGRHDGAEGAISTKQYTCLH